MEDVLAVYTRPYDPVRPVICMDEAAKQLLVNVREPLPAQAGQPVRVDYEYERAGVANLFIFNEPLAGLRYLQVSDRRTRIDWAEAMRWLADDLYPDAETIVIVMDNLNTHAPASFYAAFAPHEARRLATRFEWHYTPKHGSWLNMAEIELSVLARQCLADRLPDKATLEREVLAWQRTRNSSLAKIDWRFNTADARIKLKHLYPKFDA